MNRPSSILTVILLAASCVVACSQETRSASSAAQLPAKCVPSAPTQREIQAKDSSGGLVVSAETQAILASDKLSCWDVTRPDGTGYEPSEKVTDFKITLNGAPILVPPSAVADIIDLHTISVDQVANRYRVRIDGADAAEAYSVVLNVNSLRITDRVVTSEDGHVVERTVYVP